MRFFEFDILSEITKEKRITKVFYPQSLVSLSPLPLRSSQRCTPSTLADKTRKLWTDSILSYTRIVFFSLNVLYCVSVLYAWFNDCNKVLNFYISNCLLTRCTEVETLQGCCFFSSCISFHLTRGLYIFFLKKIWPNYILGGKNYWKVIKVGKCIFSPHLVKSMHSIFSPPIDLKYIELHKKRLNIFPCGVHSL